MMRLCPKCDTERDVSEVFCEGTVDAQICGWSLSDIPVRPSGWRPVIGTDAPIPETPAARTCANGHPAEPGDLLCEVCGSDIDVETPVAPSGPSTKEQTDGEDATVIAGWRLERRVDSGSRVRERYIAVRESDGREALLTLYVEGREPDLEVYEVLRTLSHDHVPDILETGRWQGRAFEVGEDLRGGTLAELGLLPDDLKTLSSIVFEVGKALHAFAECGLRHRDLRPGAVMVRTREPLDLVITSFGSARLSEFDLDIVSPLETTRYTAPEAVAGGVAAASDWWSLGMLLLEQVTRGACFEGINDQAFLIHVLTNGAPIPEGLDPSVDLLLRGLLALDRRERWGWTEATRWLAGDMPEAPASSRGRIDTDNRRRIRLGGQQYGSPKALALAAARADVWDEARALLSTGALLTWMEESGLDARMRNEVRRYAELEEVSPDIRLALTLKTLNPSMPLVCRGEIVTPNWLLDHPDAGYELIAGPVPAILEAKDAEPWLASMRTRADRIRERARQLDIAMDEDLLRVHLLSSSRSRLAAVWADRRRVLPDTDHPGLLAILERKQSEDDDYILLLGADTGQFRSSDAIVDEAAEAAGRAGVAAFDREAATGWLDRSRRELYAAIEGRTEGFSRCGFERIDEWADQFRLERRLPLARALALVAVPHESWIEPPKQSYVATLLDFFSKRITGAVMRGPLTRMVIGKTTARVDLAELGSGRQPAASILNHLLRRNAVSIAIDPGALMADPKVERRVRLLHSHATLYRRDTGIDGLYMGFPFLVMQEARTTTKPRIAPILLWPVRLHPEVGSRGRINLEFDHGREEVRLNPAFETLLGADAARRWREAADEVLGRSSVTAAEVVEAFAEFGTVTRELAALPGKDVRVRAGEDRIACSAALFHLAYLGQAVMEDLRQLKSIPPAGSSLETALRVGDLPVREAPTRAPEIERFFTAASDPSQEAAVMEARTGRGLVVEGPPGTGKSQTIVNMVADAIGRGKSLLVVCQKQAALEVVHKRLEAEGLGNRIVMINDVNKDRRATIQAIRDQLEAIHSRSFGASAWRLQRLQLASRIEALEADLDGQHRALHQVDEQTGLTYRLILGDLIGYTEAAGIVVPALRQALAGLDPGEVASLQEACAPLARLWLPAKYEDSALGNVEPFAPDEAAVAALTDDLLAFDAAEKARAEVVERTPHAVTITDPEPYEAWAAANGAAFADLADGERERLARWLPLLTPGEGRRLETLNDELASLRSDLAEVIPAEIDATTGALTLGMNDADLVAWRHMADDLAEDPGFLGRLSIGRWLRRRRLARFVREGGVPDSRAFRAALHREETLRPLRSRLAAVRTLLSEPQLDLGPSSPSGLREIIHDIGERLATADALVSRLSDYPIPATAYAMARQGTRSAVTDLLEGLEQAFARIEGREVSFAALARLEHWMGTSWRAEATRAITEDGIRPTHVGAVIAALPTLAAYQRFRMRVGQLDDRVMNVFRLLRGVDDRLSAIDPALLDASIRTIIGRESRLAWKSRIEATSPALLFEASELEGRAEALAEADKEMRRLNRRFLVDGLDATLLRPMREWEDITRLQGQRAKRLREFLDKGVDLGLMTLRPVWLVNPDVASRLLPLKKGLFDAVIYDEASQMPIEYALPTLFRSKTMVVSGDEKQMPPTAFFSSRVESDEAEIFEGEEEPEDAEQREQTTENWNRREIKDCPDLLQLAKTVIPSTTLQIHYRSAYRELIQFSNASFYRNDLSVPARHPDGEIRRVRPIEVVRVDGLYESQSNRSEAERVVDLLADLWLARPRKTVGVVTFNRKQADLIDDVLEARAEHDVAFRSALSEERDRVEGGEDMGFFVKNVENVQGDERDIIIFSSTFGRNAQGTFRRSFGVLGQVGGERRLNVAVTRAREKVIIVTSMPIAEISDLLTTRRQAVSPRDYLQGYLEYARALSAGELENASGLLRRLLPERQERRFHAEQDHDGFQKAVEAFIRDLGWEPTEVGDDGAFGLDFAIEDPRTGLYGIGIECDAPRHPLLDTARAREMWRPAVLSRSIPVVHRVSSHRWYHEPAVERVRLERAIWDALSAEKAA
jgi:hypothetical protein